VVASGAGCAALFVSWLNVELFELVSIVVEVLALSLPLWLVAEAPVADVSVPVSVAPISPVSLRAQPAKQIKVAAINANFFMFQLLVLRS
jgi:hypothetical protein